VEPGKESHFHQDIANQLCPASCLKQFGELFVPVYTPAHQVCHQRLGAPFASLIDKLLITRLISVFAHLNFPFFLNCLQYSFELFRRFTHPFFYFLLLG
jgi:hypothetical protein